MSEQKVTRSLIVTDPAGVHVRTASAIQAITRRSQSEVTIVSAYHKAKGTDIWDLLALAAPCGSTITLEVEGPDAAEILDTLEPIFTGDETVLASALQKK
jgi:phosphotransferase system HPr (HPr) family protein